MSGLDVVVFIVVGIFKIFPDLFQLLRVPMYEDGWELFSGGLASPATREDFLTAVSDLDAVMVRATVDDRGRDVENVLRYGENNVGFFTLF